MLKESSRRVRFLTRDEARKLLAELPIHLADMAAFSLVTGLRRANVTDLQWTQVDLVRRLGVDSPGSRESPEGNRSTAQRRKQRRSFVRAGRETCDANVFCFRGKPVHQVSTKAWYQALERVVGIKSFPLALSATHLGELARAERYAAFSHCRNWEDEKVGGDGAAVRAPVSGAPCAVRGSFVGRSCK